MVFMSGEVKSVGVKELKNRLSEYLRDVRSGTRVLISDRGTVIAELHEPQWQHSTQEPENAVIAEWRQAGIVRAPLAKKRKTSPSPVKLPEGAAQRLLEDERQESAP
jgi:antitoxin (DNA-binding transcriptional repressor) of toxin-antitoxin stability system